MNAINRVDARMAERLDSAPKGKRERRDRPATERLKLAWAQALAEDGCAPVFHCLMKCIEATWAARSDHRAKADAHFSLPAEASDKPRKPILSLASCRDRSAP